MEITEASLPDPADYVKQTDLFTGISFHFDPTHSLYELVRFIVWRAGGKMVGLRELAVVKLADPSAACVRVGSHGIAFLTGSICIGQMLDPDEFLLDLSNRPTEGPVSRRTVELICGRADDISRVGTVAESDHGMDSPLSGITALLQESPRRITSNVPHNPTESDAPTPQSELASLIERIQVEPAVSANRPASSGPGESSPRRRKRGRPTQSAWDPEMEETLRVAAIKFPGEWERIRSRYPSLAVFSGVQLRSKWRQKFDKK